MTDLVILAVDTTGEPLSLALSARGRVYRFHKILKAPHDETLLPRVEALLKRAKLGLKDLDVVAAASGPGRFTGIRIGMAFAAVAASALGKKALAVSRIEAAAQGGTSDCVAAVVPGWREEKFCQLFKRTSKGLAAAEPPAWLDAAGWPSVLSGLKARGAEIVEKDPSAEDLLAAALTILAAGRKPAFEPLYLKPAGYEAKRKAGAAFVADLDAVAAVAASRPTSAGWTRRQFAAEVDNPRSRFFVAEDAGEIAGYALFVLAPEEAQIVDVAVRVERERRGLGRGLLEAIFREAESLGCLRATLEVSARNEPALGLYRSSGFAVVGRRPKFYNDGSDAVLMDRKIP